MKRPKKASPYIKKIESSQLIIKCPHCYTILINHIDDNTIQYKCSYCKNTIIIDWDNVLSDEPVSSREYTRIL